jgi:hypothetical protein
MYARNGRCEAMESLREHEMWSLTAPSAAESENVLAVLKRDVLTPDGGTARGYAGHAR